MNQKNQNPNPNLRRRLCGGARDLWWTQAAVRVCEDASARMEVVGGAMINVEAARWMACGTAVMVVAVCGALKRW